MGVGHDGGSLGGLAGGVEAEFLGANVAGIALLTVAGEDVGRLVCVGIALQDLFLLQLLEGGELGHGLSLDGSDERLGGAGGNVALVLGAGVSGLGFGLGPLGFVERDSEFLIEFLSLLAGPFLFLGATKPS